MNKYHNMSAPPKSEINIEIKQIDNLVKINPTYLYDVFKCDENNLIKKINNYINKNPNYIDKSPKGYMFALDTLNEDLEYEGCADVNLIISVLSKVVGNIYIPNRDPKITEENFNRTLYFNKEEIYG